MIIIHFMHIIIYDVLSFINISADKTHYIAICFSVYYSSQFKQNDTILF